MNWTKEETNKLIVNYSTHTNKELMEMFPKRSFLSIYKKAKTFKLSKDKDVKFMDRSNSQPKGSEHYNWKNGKKRNYKGYILVSRPGHKRADPKGYVMEHIVAFEEATGVEVPKNCCVHHINRNKQDNRVENLCLMTMQAHTLLHHCGAKRSSKTKYKLSQWAKKRLSDKTKHPRYKNIDIEELLKLRECGAKVKDICKKYNINKTTYYAKIKEYKN